MLRRKEHLLNFMTTLKQTEFEVNKIIRIVTLFLDEYSKEYGQLWVIEFWIYFTLYLIK